MEDFPARFDNPTWWRFLLFIAHYSPLLFLDIPTFVDFVSEVFSSEILDQVRQVIREDKRGKWEG